MKRLIFISFLISAFTAGLAERAAGAARIVPDNAPKTENNLPVADREFVDLTGGVEGVNFFDNFDSYTAGMQLVVQNPTDWQLWSGGSGGGEDPYVSNAYAYSGANSVVLAFANDLVRTHESVTTGMWKTSWQMYIPTGKAGYFNTLSGFDPNPRYWAMEVYFDAGGAGRLLTGDPQTNFTWTEDIWMTVELIVDLDLDMAQFLLEGDVIHQWQWTLGASGGTGPLQLDATDLYGATANDQMFVDDFEVAEIVINPDDFLDDFEAYAAGTQLVVQNNTDWDTWSSLPGSSEDPFVSAAYAYSGSNSVVIAQNNDLVRYHGQRTTGSWGISFQVYIPAGKAGYFNTMSGFTPNPFYWAMEAYFDAGGAGRLVPDGATVSFTWTEATWQLVEVIVDLDQDQAQFVLDGNVIHQWQWTGGGAALQLDVNDFFGATANDEMYFDDYHFMADTLRPLVDPNTFLDDFEAYVAGTQLVVQNNTDWDTWSSLPGSSEDPFVSAAYAYSGSNSVVIAQNNDLVRYHGQRTTGSWGISFQMYIPSGKQGYFNTMSGFTPNPFYWAMEVYFDPAGAGRLLPDGTTVNFTWTEATWQLVEVIVDLDQDQAQFILDGNVIQQWQWTGGGAALQLDVNDFFGATANDEMYFDDFLFMADTLRPTLAVDDPTAAIPVVYDLGQNYPNPFNPSTRITYALPEQATVTLKIYNLLGQEVITLADNAQEAGYHEVVWNARNTDGQSVGTGVYFYRIEAKGTSGEVYTDFKKMLFLK